MIDPGHRIKLRRNAGRLTSGCQPGAPYIVTKEHHQKQCCQGHILLANSLQQHCSEDGQGQIQRQKVPARRIASERRDQVRHAQRDDQREIHAVALSPVAQVAQNGILRLIVGPFGPPGKERYTGHDDQGAQRLHGIQPFAQEDVAVERREGHLGHAGDRCRR